tara:strand:+ start:1711 stop:1884 length:174 start_codon:yes stop_codon:yes gene_type:complete
MRNQDNNNSSQDSKQPPMPPAELKTFEGWHSDEEETYVGWDTVTGDDGKEYPIKDRD